MNKFQTMFRGQEVIIEYGLCNGGKEIDYAVITDDNPSFIHPDYEYFDDSLHDFHCEVYSLVEKHIKKVASALATR